MALVAGPAAGHLAGLVADPLVGAAVAVAVGVAHLEVGVGVMQKRSNDGQSRKSLVVKVTQIRYLHVKQRTYWTNCT